MLYDEEYDESHLQAEEPWYLLLTSVIIVWILYSGICLKEKIITLWRSL